MRLTTTFILTIFSLTVFGQKIKEMTPTLGYLVDRSLEGEIEFLKKQAKCEFIWRRAMQIGREKLSAEDKEILDNCDATYENYWDVLEQGCSWYCGGGLDTISATSSLKPMNDIDYSPKNIHDLSYKTAWIEGVPGDGIGESITYHFPPHNPRITEIIVVNGYVKSPQAWRDNSRVKKLKMYVDNQAFAILNLEDSRQEQHFKFEPLGHRDRQDWGTFDKKPWWTIKFEILEVYKGDKYEDTAITEIYFDGIDVH